MKASYLWIVLCAAVSGTADHLVHAGESCCACCGCAAASQKVCRLECGEKKVEVICWGCKCEDFCVPCRSERGGKHCKTVCENCGEGGDREVSAQPKHFVWFDWLPGSGKIYTKTKLMKKVETVTIPSYQWVAEDMCAQCAARAAEQPGTIVYAAPREDVRPAAGAEKSVLDLVRLPRFVK